MMLLLALGDMLNVSKELDMDVSIIPRDNPSYVQDGADDSAESTSRLVDVFDVLLAGVESVD